MLISAVKIAKHIQYRERLSRLNASQESASAQCADTS